MTNDNTDPLAARLAQIRERNEAHIKFMAFTEWTVQREPCGNVRLLLAAVEAVLALADEAGPVCDNLGGGAYAWSLDPATVRAVISAELPGESLPGLREQAEGERPC